MKTKILFVFLLVLIAVAKVFAQNLIYDGKPISVILSPDKSKVSVVTAVTEIDTLSDSMWVIKTTSEIVGVCTVINEAQKYINEERANLLIANDTCALPDSLVPRWTHVFGKDTYVQRKLEIIDSEIFLKTTGIIQTSAAKKVIFWTSVQASIILIFLILMILIWVRNDNILGKIIRWTLFVLFFVILINNVLGNHDMTFFDSLFLTSTIFFPGFLATFVKLPKNKEIIKEITPSWWWSKRI